MQFLPMIRILHQDLQGLLKEATRFFQMEEQTEHLRTAQEVKAKATTFTTHVRVLPMQAVILLMV